MSRDQNAVSADTAARNRRSAAEQTRAAAAGAMSSSSLINFSSLEDVLKTVSEQQKAIFSRYTLSC